MVEFVKLPHVLLERGRNFSKAHHMFVAWNDDGHAWASTQRPFCEYGVWDLPVHAMMLVPDISMHLDVPNQMLGGCERTLVCADERSWDSMAIPPVMPKRPSLDVHKDDPAWEVYAKEYAHFRKVYKPVVEQWMGQASQVAAFHGLYVAWDLFGKAQGSMELPKVGRHHWWSSAMTTIDLPMLDIDVQPLGGDLPFWDCVVTGPAGEIAYLEGEGLMSVRRKKKQGKRKSSGTKQEDQPA